MKLSIVLSTQPASFSALAYRGALAENIAKISRYGYDGVELAVRDPGLLDVTELLSILQNAHLPVPAIGTGQAYGEEGLSLTHPDPFIRDQAIKRLQAQLALAEQLQAVVIIGLLRGTCQAAERPVYEQRFLESLQQALHDHPQTRVVIEPINRYETQLLNTVTEAMRFLDRLKLEQVGLLLDTFHMNIEEPSLLQSMVVAQDRLFHFHLADSNRWHPGAGHIDFGAVVDVLQKIGYPGWLSAEILPRPDPDSAAANTIQHMRFLLGKRAAFN